MAPRLFGFLEHLYATTARRSAFATAFAVVALAQCQQIVLVFTPQIGDGLEPLIAAFEDKVGWAILDVLEIAIVLDDQSLVAALGMFACFDQQVEPLLAIVVRDALEA